MNETLCAIVTISTAESQGLSHIVLDSEQRPSLMRDAIEVVVVNHDFQPAKYLLLSKLAYQWIVWNTGIRFILSQFVYSYSSFEIFATIQNVVLGCTKATYTDQIRKLAVLIVMFIRSNPSSIFCASNQGGGIPIIMQLNVPFPAIITASPIAFIFEPLRTTINGRFVDCIASLVSWLASCAAITAPLDA